jgi:NAD(P)-dependent dehydrogenase (short-subunit alcohol dehydrogenase family)
MANVCVITGGGSGMGFEAAKFMPKDKIIVVSGRTMSKLEGAVAQLKELGYDAYAKTCDTSSRESVKELVEFALSLGEIKNVINSAGVSPAMKGTPEGILKINALGTVYVNQEFSKVMKPGSVIVDVSSNSAYVLPSFIIPKKAYALAETDEDKFVKTLVKRASMAKGEYQRKGFAYSLSKNFVVWYAKKCAFEYGLKGIRVVSLSPGLIATDMGNLEKEEGGMLIPFSAEERMGKPEELGYALATVADERNGYLAGVDVLCDGGSTNGMKEFKKKKK